MLGIYAVKKRKKPVQKSPKPPPPEGAKSNPSKRHRDRLNAELDKLTSLLPYSEDVRSRLDKLSVLRLSVGYLKVKSFFNATLQKNHSSWLEDKPVKFGGNGLVNGGTLSEGELLLQALNGFVLVVTADGQVFYASATIQDYLGFHQSDVIHQSVFELIHTDDRDGFRHNLHWALNPPPFKENESGTDVCSVNAAHCSSVITYDPQHLPPENSSFLERNFVSRFRCLLDNSSGFLALNFQGRLKFLHGQNKRAEDGTLLPPQLALFAVATPLLPPSILELRTKTLLFQTKHKLDFTPMGCDARGKVVLGYTEAELCLRGTGYQFIHAADMMYCAENHIRMIKTGESGMTVFRLLSKQSGWIWVQANARLVYKGGRPDCIIARQRALTNEEGEEHLRKRALQLPFSFTTGEAVLYESSSPTSGYSDCFSGPSKPSKDKDMTSGPQKPVDPSSILGAMIKQDELIIVSHPDTEPRFSFSKAQMSSAGVVGVPADNWSSGKDGIKDKNDPLNDLLELLLTKNGENGDITSTFEQLELSDLDLQQLEDYLKADDDHQLPSDLSDILNNDVLSYVEDILCKENSMPESPFQQMSMQPSQNVTASVQQLPWRTVHQELTETGLQNPYLAGLQESVRSDPGNMPAANCKPSHSLPRKLTPGVMPDRYQKSMQPVQQSQLESSQPNLLGMGTIKHSVPSSSSHILQEMQSPLGQHTSSNNHMPAEFTFTNQMHYGLPEMGPSPLKMLKFSENSIGVAPQNQTSQRAAVLSSQTPNTNLQDSVYLRPHGLVHSKYQDTVLPTLQSVTDTNQNSLQKNHSNLWNSGTLKQFVSTSQNLARHVQQKSVPFPLQIQPGKSQNSLADTNVVSDSLNHWFSPMQDSAFTENKCLSKLPSAQNLNQSLQHSQMQKSVNSRLIHASGNKSYAAKVASIQQEPSAMANHHGQQQQHDCQSGHQYALQQQLETQLYPQVTTQRDEGQFSQRHSASNHLEKSNRLQMNPSMGADSVDSVYQNSLVNMVSSSSTATPNYMFSSCDFENSDSTFLNETFPLDCPSLSLPVGQQMKPATNQSIQQAACYFEGRSQHPMMSSSLMPQTEAGINTSLWSFEPSIPPLALTDGQLSRPLLNYNGQLKQVCPSEDSAAVTFAIDANLPNETAYFPDGTGQVSFT
ncbi:aryl hydrocarbon receptor-like [Protopterus annectens]|uniref:aryl hydrocarbon receptor-like n=1 Tax=Protopterus annectens TaxID=7888 RepID=UPI001CFA86B7|nr:aryl hydrocarbon receptor-like [Protopterus annectens]